MKKIITVMLVVMMITSALAGCTDASNTQADPTDAVGINITVEEVQLRDIETTATYTGEVVTDDFAYVTSKVSAKVKSVNADIGDWVEAGTVLLVLDSSDYEYQLNQAQASYAQAEAAYNSAVTALGNVGGANQQTINQLEQAKSAAQIAYNDAKTNYERQKTLYDMGAISLASYEAAKSALDNATIAYETAKKNYDLAINVLTPGNNDSAERGVETALAAKNAAQLAVNQAKTNIANTRITAPISGYVSAKNVAIGQFASAGMNLFTISSSDNLEVEIKVTESVVPFVTVGGNALVTVPTVGMDNAETTVSMVNPVKDAMSGMYTVRVSMPNKDDSIKVGMFADVTLVTSQSAEAAISVSSTSVMQDEDGYYVYTIEGNTAVKTAVTPTVSDGVYTVITKGLEEGDIVACDGKEYISESNNIVNIVR